MIYFDNVIKIDAYFKYSYIYAYYKVNDMIKVKCMYHRLSL